MRSLFYSIIIFATSIAYGWNIAPQAFREKCASEAPAWMTQQIEKDLAPFTRYGVNAQKIENTLEAIFKVKGGEVSEIVRICLQNGKVAWWKTPFSLSSRAQQRLSTFLSALELLTEITPLPDLDFLLSLANHYDRPLFSLYTKVPVFTICKESSFSQAILFPSGLWEPDREILFAKILQQAQTISWEERTPRGFWRGSLSELYTNFYWDFNGRPRLVFFSRTYPDLIDAAFIENAHMQTMDRHWKNWIENNRLIKPFVLPEDQLAFRYLIAIDGDASPASLSWQLFSGSVLLKSESTHSEWYYGGLEPFVHYLPFNPNRSDLKERIAWLQEHDDLAHQMADRAKAFAEERLSDENVFLYTYKLLKAYSAFTLSQ